MRYHLMFCLASQDDGTATNPKLCPILDDFDAPLVYSCWVDVYKAQLLMSRGSKDLRFYAVELPDISEQP